jgi:CHASE2 domain-containing sensor protein
MDNIWKNAARKQRACDLRDATAKLALTAPVHTTDTTTLHQKPVTVTTAPSWCDPETVTLEQIDKNSRRLQQDWPKEDGIPFPPNMLETLRASRAAVIARDTRRGSSTQADAEAILRKAEKKRCLREKRATAHTTASPTVIANPPATATIVSNPPTTADCSSNQIGTNIATAAPSTSSDGYNTAHPEQLYSLLTAAALTMLDVTPDPCKTDPNPADYSLNDIEQTICKIRKCHEKMGALVPESVQETAEALT